MKGNADIGDATTESNSTKPSPVKFFLSLLSNVSIPIKSAKAPLRPLAQSKQYFDAVLSGVKSVNSDDDAWKRKSFLTLVSIKSITEGMHGHLQRFRSNAERNVSATVSQTNATFKMQILRRLHLVVNRTTPLGAGNCKFL